MSNPLAPSSRIGRTPSGPRARMSAHKSIAALTLGLLVTGSAPDADAEQLLAAATVEPRNTRPLQSPIDLPAKPPPSAKHHEIAIHYADTAEHLIHRDHTLEMEYDPGSELAFDGKQYRLVQLHFHTPSEHLITHRGFPVELHLVHESDEGGQLVLSVLFEIGTPNSFIANAFWETPAAKSAESISRAI